jgi:YggT family protein
MLITVINALFTIFYVLLFANIVISWVRPDPYHPTWGPIVRFIISVTEPVLMPVRRFLPPMGGLDFSVLIVLLLARFLQRALISLVI